jgi:hypothetical protein
MSVAEHPDGCGSAATSRNGAFVSVNSGHGTNFALLTTRAVLLHYWIEAETSALQPG